MIILHNTLLFYLSGFKPDLSHLLVVVVSEVQIIWWVDFILTVVAAWKKQHADGQSLEKMVDTLSSCDAVM